MMGSTQEESLYPTEEKTANKEPTAYKYDAEPAPLEPPASVEPAAVEPAAVEPEPAPVVVTTAEKLCGAWRETSIERGSHIIDGSSLAWSNGETSDVSINGLEVKINYKGSLIVARLDETAQTLTWDDGDVWERAGLSGIWNERDTGVMHMVYGSNFATQAPSGLFVTRSLDAVDSKSFSITLQNVQHTCTLNATGTELNWTDGDAWVRAPSSASNLEEYLNFVASNAD